MNPISHLLPTSAYSHLSDNDSDEDLAPVFPILHNSKDSVFFQFGYDWQHKNYLFPALIKSLTGSTLEATYGTKLRLSVFDQRLEPSLGIWSEWTDECSQCGMERQKMRERRCNCLDNESCYACEEHLIEVIRKLLFWLTIIGFFRVKVSP